MRSILSVTLLFCTMCCGADDLFKTLSEAAQKQNRNSVAKLYEAAKIYVAKTLTKEEQEKWTKTWESRVKDAEATAQAFTEENYTNTTMYDFCSDNKGDLANPKAVKKEKIVFLTMLYIRIVEKQFELPSRVVDKLTPENTKKIMDFLAEQRVATAPSPENKP